MKKSVLIMVLGAAVGSLLTGCSSTPVALVPVGPNPSNFPLASSNGQLEVFSALSGHVEGNNPSWYRHTDYYVCDSGGQRLQRVNNFMGHYSQAPRILDLPPGHYLIEARAEDILRARIPVVIRSGELTEVHLDGLWQPVADASHTELVFAPGGYPVGWSAKSQNANGTNH